MNAAELFAKTSHTAAASVNKFVLEKYFQNIKCKKDKVSILDVGSGDGYTTLNLLLPRFEKKCKELIGMDVSEDMTNFATKQCNQAVVKFIKMDASIKPLPSEFRQRFDHAFTFFCLHWIPNRSTAFQNFFNMLTAEGDLLGSYVQKFAVFDAYTRMSRYPRWKQQFSEKFLLSLENLKNEKAVASRMLKETGFRNYFLETEKKTITWRNSEEFKGFLQSIDPIISKLSEHDKTEYMDHYMDELKDCEGITFAEGANNQGAVSMDHTMLIVYASKT